MKETGTTYWNPSSYPGSNESGFSARGTGEIMFGMTNNFKTRTTYHSSTEATNTSDFKAVMLHKDADNANVTTTNKILIAYPVRCLQDSN